MKKVLFLALAAASFSLASCSEEDPGQFHAVHGTPGPPLSDSTQVDSDTTGTTDAPMAEEK